MDLRERQIQYALLQSPALLQELLGFPPTLVAAYLDIAQWGFTGEIDFILEDPQQQKYVVELERHVSGQSKVEHVVEQVTRYAQAAAPIYGVGRYRMVVLVADSSPSLWLRAISDRLGAAGVTHRIVGYDLPRVERRYLSIQEHTDSLFGFDHEPIERVSIASLAQLNEISAQFKHQRATELSREQLFQLVSWKHPSSLRARLRYAEALGLLALKGSQVCLTVSGTQFRDYTNLPYRVSDRYFSLTEPQQRILQQNILVELRVAPRVNRVIMQLVVFLQYLVLLRGRHLPRGTNQPLPEGVMALFREMIQKRASLTDGSIRDMIYWTSRYCVDLGLITVVEDGTFYRALFTEAGSRFLRLVTEILNFRREERHLTVF